MDKRWLAGLLLGCSMAVVAGSGHRTTMKDAEASMLLTGTINVDPEGAVTGFTIDHRDKVPSAVTQLVDSTVPQWQFEPVARDGHPVAAKTTMSMLVVATQPDDTHYRIAINGATFGGDKPSSEKISSKSMNPPTYPAGPLHAGVSGAAYLVLHTLKLPLDRLAEHPLRSHLHAGRGADPGHGPRLLLPDHGEGGDAGRRRHAHLRLRG